MSGSVRKVPLGPIYCALNMLEFFSMALYILLQSQLNKDKYQYPLYFQVEGISRAIKEKNTTLLELLLLWKSEQTSELGLSHGLEDKLLRYD